MIKQKTYKRMVYTLSLALGLGFATVTYAEAPAGHGGGEKSMKQGHHQSKAGHHKKSKHSKMGGTFSPHWAKTLTDEQKTSVDIMHLKVAQLEAVQRAKIKMLKAELNVMAGSGKDNKAAIYGKIDEILMVKKGIMRSRFDHITEMRAELTEQQRISYDMGILKRDKMKHKH